MDYWDVWDVSKRPETPLKRPSRYCFAWRDESEGELASESGGRVGRLKSSQVVPRRG